ncbi:MAG: YoaK family protein [Acidobacteriaceae bacterium]
MRTIERDGLLMALAAASGSADGWSFFGIGHAFVANMTGNTVLLGIAIFHLQRDILHPLIALCSYLVGTVLGTLITRRVKPGALWARNVSWALFVEALLLIGAEIGWIATAHAPSPRLAAWLLAEIAVAIGLQSGAMVQLRVPGVVTTYITGTWTTLTNGLTLLITHSPRTERQKASFEERFALQAAILGVYFLSAVLTGWFFLHHPNLVGAIPATAVLLVAVYGGLRN